MGTTGVPRLCVNVTLAHSRAQLIDDTNGTTLCEASDLVIKEKLTKLQKAEKVGTSLGEKAKTLKIKTVVFDRGHKLYHGRVKAIADAARKQGLEF